MTGDRLRGMYELAGRVRKLGVDSRVLNLSADKRALLVAVMPRGGRGHGLTQGEWSELMHVDRKRVTAATGLLLNGPDDLVELVWTEVCSVYTARRVAALDDAGVAEFVKAVRSGVNPRTAAPRDRAQMNHDAGPRGASLDALNGRHGRKDQHVTLISNLARQLAVWTDYTFSNIEELDDSVSAEDAAVLAPELARSLRVLNRINRQVRERMPQ